MPRFPKLRAVRCELRRSGFDRLPFTPGQSLHEVTLTGCGEDLDLRPLLELRSLEYVELSAPRGLPGLAVLKAMLADWILTLESPACANRLPELAALNTMTWLHLRGGDDLGNLDALPPRPRSLRTLSLYGFPRLTSLDGIERWQGLTGVALFDCPQVGSFAPLAALTSLEEITLGLFPEESRDLSPLTHLPRLERLYLMGHSEFDVSSLAGARDLLIVVAPKSRLAGADRLGPTSRVIEKTHAGGP